MNTEALTVGRKSLNGKNTRKGHMGFFAIPLKERFEAKIDRSPGGCWNWTGSLTGGKGYGHIAVNGRPVQAHRIAYELYVGPIPEGLQIDHLCRNRACVNPSHLEAVTCRENLLRGNGVNGVNHRKTHCAKGHPYDQENTRLSKRGARLCQICRANARQRLREKRALQCR